MLMGWWLRNLSAAEVASKIRTRVLPNLQYLPRSRIRVCRACRQLTLFVAFGQDEEFHLCLRCRANLRYEMLAEYIRDAYPALERLDVLELDFQSPIRSVLAAARSYTPSFYRDNTPPGLVREDGVQCQDITRLTFADKSLDLIVSSDVLEHVPDLQAALCESARVLRSGGAHVFTVPPRANTVRRAEIINGQLSHLVTPAEYHLDPLSRHGVLAFWDLGPDMPRVFNRVDLRIEQVAGPEGNSDRIIWAAKKI